MASDGGAQPYAKASPKLRRFAQQHLGGHAQHDADMARQQAAVRFAGPKTLYKQAANLKQARPLAQQIPETPEFAESDAESDAAPDALPRDLPETAQTQAHVFLRLNGAAEAERMVLDLPDRTRVEVVTQGSVGIASLTEEQLKEVLAQPEVASADMAEAVKRPLVLRGPIDSGEALEPTPRAVVHEDLHRGGDGVLIGIIDVDGFDFAHEDFLDAQGGTRFVRIWDQGSEGPRPGPALSSREPYGAQFTQDHLNRAIRDSQDLEIAPYYLEPQSSLVVGSHGTHVASIAAGKSGVCPRADIAAVLIHLPEADWDRRRSFTDSTRITDAVDYLLGVKEELGYAALSINISLGTNGHAHDGTSGASRWIDAQLDQQGCCVSIAAGNAGQEAPQDVDDLGFIVGRVHTSGVIPAAGLTKDIRIEVAGFPIEDVSENELELWYSPQDRIAVSVRPPGGGPWIGPVEPGDDLSEVPAQDSQGRALGTHISVYNDIYRPENGSNHATVFLTPSGEAQGLSRRVHPGVWTVRLHARTIRDGRYDGWIERDDPIPVQGLAPQAQWHYPAFFAGESNVDRSSLSTLACTRTAMSVANVDDFAERMAITSSQGPTRDGQTKPEVGAPGTRIVAACGFHPRQKWIAMTGTSMASPYVAGVAALMLAVEPSLTSAQIRAIMIHTTRPLPGTDYAWSDEAGYGRLDPQRCIEEAKALSDALAGGSA